jgi:hypothetical protein
MKDNFDLKKYLVENKTIEKYNPFTTENTEKQPLNEGNLRDKVKEMILKELEDYQDYDEKELEEAKEDEEEVEEETEEVTDEEIGEEPAAEEDGGIEDIAADMEGTEGELMDHLMSALKVAKGMDNEKLSTQIGNTLKFFVSEYIGGEE